MHEHVSLAKCDFFCVIVLNYYAKKKKKPTTCYLKISTKIVTQLPSKYRAINLAVSALLLCFT